MNKKNLNLKVLNPYLFFIIKNGKIICWDYKNHHQHEIESYHFSRLLMISEEKNLSFSKIDKELEEAEILIFSVPEQEWGWDYLAKIFHFGTQIPNEELSEKSENNPESFSSCYLNLSEEILPQAPIFNIEKKGEKISLPSPNYKYLENHNLLSILKERKTCRSFNRENVPFEVLSTLLHTVFGNFRSDEDEYKLYGLKQVGLRKSSPSAGGLNSTEAYLIAQHIKGVPKGIYHYQAHNHNLTLIELIDIEPLISDLLCGQYFAEDLSFGIFLTSRFDKLWHKYPHSRAYRIALLDVGHISQTFQLVATALKLNPWLTGAFADEEVSKLLQLQDICEQPLFFVGAGLGPRCILDPATQKLMLPRDIDNAK